MNTRVPPGFPVKVPAIFTTVDSPSVSIEEWRVSQYLPDDNPRLKCLVAAWERRHAGALAWMRSITAVGLVSGEVWLYIEALIQQQIQALEKLGEILDVRLNEWHDKSSQQIEQQLEEDAQALLEGEIQRQDCLITAFKKRDRFMRQAIRCGLCDLEHPLIVEWDVTYGSRRAHCLRLPEHKRALLQEVRKQRKRGRTVGEIYHHLQGLEKIPHSWTAVAFQRWMTRNGLTALAGAPRIPRYIWSTSIAPILKQYDPPNDTGRKRIDPHAALCAILYRLYSKCSWNQLPTCFPDHRSVHRTYQRWKRLEILDSILAECAGLGGVGEWGSRDREMEGSHR